METIRSLQSCWRRRTYEKLEGLPAPRKKEAEVTLGGGKRRRRRRQQSCNTAVVVAPVMRLKKLSVLKTPGRVMAGLRDAYVNVMLMFAREGGAAAKKGGGAGGGGALWDRRIPKARQGSLGGGGDFERRLMIHLYNSVIDNR